ncbi:MAG TPA: glycosyl hydrolase, partial [Cyclobacteriaceae bacterium]
WTEITPKDLPKNSVVAIIDESRHAAGTAYVAAFRYQVDDRQPYVFRTKDYGKTWTKIVTGIKDGHFARSVREDHIKPGLLFLGTEHGVYTSFDAGDHWQPLQLNLPDTPIRDLVVKDNDVVLGTHGRGFWILDDIHPLRQLTPELMKQNVIFFKPGDAIRGIGNASFQYYIGNTIDSVKIEILDEKGTVVTSFVGDKAEYKADPNIPRWEREPSRPTTAGGLNVFSWNLRYPGATTFDGMILWGANAKNGPMAAPGKYQVRFTSKGYSITHPFEIKINPNLKGVTVADLQETFTLAMKIRDKESAANEAVIQIRKIRGQFEAAIKNTTDQNVLKAANDLLKKITVIEEELYQVKNRSGQDPLNFPIRLGNRISALRRSLETGDNKPTAGSYKVFDELSKELDTQLSNLNVIMNGDLPPLKATLKLEGDS